jgi:hypothetical protein
MATTTNYSWSTPDDTALVKDGAAAIRSLGTAIDTTTKNLNPSTTLGDIEYRSSTANTNTRLGIGSSGQALTVVAGVPSWAASTTSVLTTTGDLVYASAANTLARRAIGSTGDVLTVSGGLPTWSAPAAAGAFTLLSTTSLSGTTTTITITPTGYKALMIAMQGFDISGNDGIQFNINDDSLSNLAIVRGNGGTPSTNNQNQSALNYNNGDDMRATTHANGGVLWIYNPTSTSNAKPISFISTWRGSGGDWGAVNGAGGYTGSSISSIRIYTISGSSFDGGSVLIYGVN